MEIDATTPQATKKKETQKCYNCQKVGHLAANCQRQVTKETKNLRLCVDGTTIGSEEFDLVQIPHEVILGLPWLESQNPRIDWKRRHLVFPKRSLATQAEPEKVRIKEISYAGWKKHHW